MAAAPNSRSVSAATRKKKAGSVSVFAVAGSPPVQREPGGHSDKEPVPEKPSFSQSPTARDPLCIHAKMSSAAIGIKRKSKSGMRCLDEIGAPYSDDLLDRPRT
jgi:hypothetical protein